jgi:hypothetical protein
MSKNNTADPNLRVTRKLLHKSDRYATLNCVPNSGDKSDYQPSTINHQRPYQLRVDDADSRTTKRTGRTSRNQRFPLFPTKEGGEGGGEEVLIFNYLDDTDGDKIDPAVDRFYCIRMRSLGIPFAHCRAVIKYAGKFLLIDI